MTARGAARPGRRPSERRRRAPWRAAGLAVACLALPPGAAHADGTRDERAVVAPAAQTAEAAEEAGGDGLARAAAAHRARELEALLRSRERLLVVRRGQAVDALEAFLADVDADDPATPDALLRLAELRWEEARAAWLAAFARWEAGDPDQRGPPPRPDHRAALALHERLLARHADFLRIDLVLYMKAYALLEQGDDAAARAVYERLLAEHPESRFVPDALFARAEDRLTRERDVAGALEAYDAVLAHPGAPTRDVALFKSAWCLWRLDRGDEAARRFRRVLDLAAAARGAEADDDRRARLLALEDEALDFLIRLFLEGGSLAGDGADGAGLDTFLADIGAERYGYAALERLAETHAREARPGEAAAAWARLVALDPSHPRAPWHRAAMVDAWARLDAPERAIEAVEALAVATAPDGTWASQQGDRGGVADARALAERRARTLALRWHREGQEGRASRFPHVEALYAAYLRHFPDAEAAPLLRFYRGEVLFHRLEAWAEAGAAYLAAARSAGDDALARDALQGAIASFERAREATPPCAPDAAPCAGGDADAALADALALYVERFPDDPDLPEVLFRQGALQADRGAHDAALRLLGQLVERFPASPFAVRAGERILESLEGAREWANVEAWARRLRGVEAFSTPARRARLDAIVVEAVFAIGAQRAARGEHAAAAAAFERAAREWPDDPRAARALHNAGLEHRRAGDLAAAEASWSALVAAHPGTEEGARGAWDAARTYASVALLGDAARWYETYAARFPEAPRVPDALHDATRLRLAVGDHEAAVGNAARFAARFPRHAAADEVAFLAGRAHEEAGRPAEAARVYRRYLRRGRDLDRRVEAATRLGQVLDAAGDRRGAARALAEAVRLGRRHAGRLDRGLHFAAQARFLEGEALLRASEAVAIEGASRTLRRRLERKSRLLADAARVFADVVRFEVAEWVTAALFRIGRSYERFADALREAPLPEGLSDDDAQRYLDQLARFVVPIEERALEAYEGGYRTALELGIYNRWTAALREALTRLNDVVYPPLLETGLRHVEGPGLPVPPAIDGVTREVAP